MQIQIWSTLYSRFTTGEDISSLLIQKLVLYFISCKQILFRNLSNIANETYVDKLPLNKSLVKSNMNYANPAENAWRIPLLKDLLLIRSNQNVLDGFNYDEIVEIFDDICKN